MAARCRASPICVGAGGLGIATAAWRMAAWHARLACEPVTRAPAQASRTRSRAGARGPISTAGPTTIMRPPSRPSWQAAARSARECASGARHAAHGHCVPIAARRSASAARAAVARSTRTARANSSRTISGRCASASWATPTGFSPAITSRSSTARACRPANSRVPLYRRPPDLVRVGRRKRRQFPQHAAASAAASAAARSCRTTIAARSRTARSTAGISKSADLRDQIDVLFIADPGLGAHPARGRHHAAHQLRLRITASPTRRSGAC